MSFVDSIEIRVRSGDGGRGLVSFKTAKFRPRLGPDGGDGGFGGDVSFVGEVGLSTLSRFRYRQLYKAGHGQPGGPNGRTGRNGEHLVIRVPLGTEVIDADTGEVIDEITDADVQHLLAKGGKRGLGNLRFVSSRRQAPEQYTQGSKGIERNLRLELKLIADVGLVGFPNAGKSTLLSRLSSARPKIGNYPFTTLKPSLGVVDLETDTDHFGKSFVVCDIPGLIEGASQGRGLGLQFLRHVERTRALAYILSPFAPDSEDMSPEEEFLTLQKELRDYDPNLPGKPSLIILNKSDLVYDFEEVEKTRAEIERDLGIETLVISAQTGQGIDQLKWRLASLGNLS